MLYLKYKPKKLNEIIGQKTAVQILTNIIIQKRNIHGIILSGQFGCGKTLCATLFAQEINDINVIEDAYNQQDILIVDAALNSSVNDMRPLMEQIIYAPLHLKYRIVIIAGTHMLSKEAMDVLLLTLQAPPYNTIFMFTTTNLSKITKTLESRCLTIHINKIDKQIKANKVAQLFF